MDTPVFPPPVFSCGKFDLLSGVFLSLTKTDLLAYARNLFFVPRFARNCQGFN